MTHDPMDFLNRTRARSLWLFHWLRDLIQVLVICRVSVLVLVLGAYFLIAVPQGQGVLQAIGESHQDRIIDNRIWLFVAVLFWAISIWYWARILLSIDFPHIPKDSANIQFLTRHIPRLLGIIAILTVASGFLRSSRAFEIAINLKYATGQSPALALSQLQSLAWFYLFAAILFSFFVYFRRRLLAILIKDPTWLHLRHFQQLPKSSRMVLTLSVLFACASLLFFSIRPLNLLLAQDMGAASILLMAGANWIGVGSVLVWWGHHYRFPVLSMLLCLALVFSLVNDNHKVRTLPRPLESTLVNIPGIKTDFHRWLAARKAEHGSTPGKILVVIVTTAGGGIRAAYWTASILSALQDQHPVFATHVFAISSVSGGSLGAATFDALLAEQQTRHLPGCPTSKGGPLLSCSRQMLSQDFLSPTLGSMLYPEVLQWFLPFPINYFDRSVTLEETWERAWEQTTGSDRFRQQFADLWMNAADRIPSLVLNSTSVEEGNRALVSNLAIDPQVFTRVHDVRKELNKPMRLSSTIMNSARFGYLEPAGIIDDGAAHKRWHIIDGGYYENSGATTAREIFEAIHTWSVESGDWQNITPVVINISNDPINPLRHHLAVKEFLSKTLAMLTTMSQTRHAHSSYEIDRLESRVRQENGVVFHFALVDRGVPIPLGWMLSDSAKVEIDDQLDGYFQVAKRDETVDQIGQLLHGRD